MLNTRPGFISSIEMFAPYIGTLIIIILSSLAGAGALILLRSQFQKRVLFSAIYSELVDNYRTLRSMEEYLEGETHENPMMVFQGESPKTGAINAAMVQSPTLYTSLSLECDEFGMVYNYLENLFEYEKVANINPQRATIAFYDGTYTIADEPEIVQKEVKHQITDIKKSVGKSIEELDDYRGKTLYRSFLYDPYITFDPNNDH